MTISYWGGAFPEPGAGAISYWGGDFPEGAASAALVPGVGPVGVGLLALRMEGAQVKMMWKTDVLKQRDAVERQRPSLWDLPRWSYSGSAYLLGENTRATRATLARFAAQAKPFQLAIPFEGATLVADATGAVVHVEDTSKLDWCVLGQRVAVIDNDDVAIAAVIQDYTSNTITLDVAPGNTGRAFGTIVPTVPVLLDPGQGFPRFTPPDGIESWNVSGVRLTFGYEQTGTNAYVALAAFAPGKFHDATAVAAIAGTAGNSMSLQMVPDSVVPAGGVTSTGGAIVFHYKPGVTLATQAVTALRPWFTFLGPVTPGAMTSPIDDVSDAALAHGVDQVYGLMGRGATVTTFDGRSVWDRGVMVKSGSTAADTLQSMTELVDIGASYDDVGPATTPDWGRQASIERADVDEFQWFKAFLDSVQGRRRAFWLPTQREDLIPVSLSPGSLVIDGGSDFTSWFPRLRDHIQIWMPDNTFKYAVIHSYVDNLDGTYTLSLSSCSDPAYASGGGGSTLTADELYMVSWLEKCRLEADVASATWSGALFSSTLQCHVIQQST